MAIDVKVPFSGTEKQETLLKKRLAKIKKLPGATMPALQIAQEIYGYLPIEVQKIVATELNMPLEHIYGVATFYAQFSLTPKGKFEVGVCLGTACYVKGSSLVMEKVQKALGVQSGCTEDGKFSLVATRCIGCCGLAPVMTINGEVYGKIAPEDVANILAKY
ncbi:MAG: NAD(P)H-dependent oxidoreductase subunit E [Clostridia bacterium]